ncbi:MAG: type II secretion system protein GspF [Desulfobulbus propionicus]|nr:MAG: type II secretion system protein GspF [Desulfobulbus propionicus]
MPVYEYTALDSAGKKTKGILDADSVSIVRQKIRAQGKYPVDIKETNVKIKKKGSRSSLLQLGRGIKSQEIHIATRQLATLLGAGIPLVQSLNGLIEQTTNRHFQTIIAQIKDAVNEGNSLTAALQEHPRFFSKIYVNMVRAGEASGSLDVVLERLAEFGENQAALRSRIKAAMLYPILMAIVGSIVLFLLMTFVVPNITSIFEGSKQALPLPTRLLIATSTFFQRYWWGILLFLSVVFVGIKQFIQRPLGKKIWDQQKLTLPGLRDLNSKIASARLGRTLASLLAAGVPLTSSLKIVKNILNNVILSEIIDNAGEELEKGKSLAQFLRGNQYFPPMLVQMISVGEQSGAMEKMLEKAADSYEKEVESRILGLTSLIEPVMILAMGLVVSFIVISILLPIFAMNQLIG